MSTIIIGSLVGGLLLFIWQFLSWTLLNVHGPQIAYTPSQDILLETLGEHLEEGSYYLPNVPPGASKAEKEKMQTDVVGTPWARIQYHESFSMNFPANLLRGFLINVVAVFLLCWILLKIPDLDFLTVFLSTLAVGFIGYLSVSYLNNIWFQEKTWPELIDTVAQWGLCGLFLGWFLA